MDLCKRIAGVSTDARVFREAAAVLRNEVGVLRFERSNGAQGKAGREKALVISSGYFSRHKVCEADSARANGLRRCAEAGRRLGARTEETEGKGGAGGLKGGLEAGGNG